MVENSSIRVAHSPDSDDIVQFLAISDGRIDTGGRNFSFERYDTGELNRLACSAQYDVIAISAATYPKLAADYLILPHGASIGRAFGPVVVSKIPRKTEELNQLNIGIPGESTTAAALMRLVAPKARTTVIPIAPFGAVFKAIDSGVGDCAVLIHEGQILFEKSGLLPILNLGQWWDEHTGLPLPLGLNVIRRSLGAQEISAISEIIRSSIRLAVNQREQTIDRLLESGLNGAPADRAEIRRYLEMYANEDTLDMDQQCREGIVRLLTEIAPGSSVAFAP